MDEAIFCKPRQPGKHFPLVLGHTYRVAVHRDCFIIHVRQPLRHPSGPVTAADSFSLPSEVTVSARHHPGWGRGRGRSRRRSRRRSRSGDGGERGEKG